MKIRLLNKKDNNVFYLSGYRTYPIKGKDENIYVFSYTKESDKAHEFTSNLRGMSVMRELKSSIKRDKKENDWEITLTH